MINKLCIKTEIIIIELVKNNNNNLTPKMTEIAKIVN